MDFAVLTSPLWWMARQWLRFLTGLVIIAAALGVSQPGADQAADRPVLVAPAVPGAAAADAGAVRPSIVEVLVEPDSIVVAPAPARARQQRPVSTGMPASADVSSAGQRAPPVSAGDLPA
jgi:hypothetical protein